MFTVCSRTENYLTYQGVKFEYDEAVEFGELKESWRSSNIGRSESIDDDAVQEYALMIENGSPAPAIIIIKTTQGYEVLDGVQRLSAAELSGATRFAAYIVSARTKLSTQHLIRICANARINGQHTPDKRWLLQQAVEILYFGDSCSAEEISKAIGRPVTEVKKEVRFQSTTDGMRKTGYAGPLLKRGKKWFAAEIGKHCDASDWDMAPTALRQFLEITEKCNWKNGDGKVLFEDFFTLKRTQNRNREKQFQEKLKIYRNTPEVKSKLDRKGRKSPLDDALRITRSAATCLKNCHMKGKTIHDQAFAGMLGEAIREILSYARKITPRDMWLDEYNQDIFTP